MHKYKFEIFENDENGNPIKSTRSVQYAESDDGAEEIYAKHREATIKRDDGIIVRAYTVNLSVQAYKTLGNPADYFAQFHA